MTVKVNQDGAEFINVGVWAVCIITILGVPPRASSVWFFSARFPSVCFSSARIHSFSVVGYRRMITS